MRIEKDCWDAMHLDRLTECTDVSRNAELAGVVLQQTGLGHLCLITEHMTITKARIEVNIPKKHSANTGWGDKAQKKGISRFFELLYRSIVDHVDFTLVKAVLIGGPGYIGQDFFKYINEQVSAHTPMVPWASEAAASSLLRPRYCKATGSDDDVCERVALATCLWLPPPFLTPCFGRPPRPTSA